MHDRKAQRLVGAGDKSENNFDSFEYKQFATTVAIKRPIKIYCSYQTNPLKATNNDMDTLDCCPDLQQHCERPERPTVL